MATMAAPPGRGHVLRAALGNRTSACMLAFGFSSGLPFTLLIGTITAWLGDAHVDLKTVGVLAIAQLAYAFKFLWSPAVDRTSPPMLGRLGRRKGWIVAAQAVIALCLLGLAATDPAANIGRFAVILMVGALASATQDVAVDGWRIDNAGPETPVELLSSLYQLGYRASGLVGGAGALAFAGHAPWSTVFMTAAGLMAALLLVGLLAPDRQSAVRTVVEVGDVPIRVRSAALIVVGLCWAGALVVIGRFVVRTLTLPVADRPVAADFLKLQGPWIIAATVAAPLIVAALVNRTRPAASEDRGRPTDHLYRALVAPLTDLVARLRWGVLLVIGLILSYPLCYNLWASFAYPFYLQDLHYTKDEVALASKIFGILMTMLGVTLGGVLFVRVGRFPTVLLGAALPIAGNFLYADLADGGAHIDAFAHAMRLDAVGGDPRMTRLLVAIAYENVSTGLAGAAFTAFVSGIVSKRFAAVQYALLSSMTFLIGALAKSAVGEAIDAHGYAVVFRWVALAGAPAIGFVFLEWWRASRTESPAESGGTGAAA